jgi:hypothetical protein
MSSRAPRARAQLEFTPSRRQPELPKPPAEMRAVFCLPNAVKCTPGPRWAATPWLDSQAPQDLAVALCLSGREAPEGGRLSGRLFLALVALVVVIAREAQAVAVTIVNLTTTEQ